MGIAAKRGTSTYTPTLTYSFESLGRSMPRHAPVVISTPSRYFPRDSSSLTSVVSTCGRMKRWEGGSFLGQGSVQMDTLAGGSTNPYTQHVDPQCDPTSQNHNYWWCGAHRRHCSCWAVGRGGLTAVCRRVFSLPCTTTAVSWRRRPSEVHRVSSMRANAWRDHAPTMMDAVPDTTVMENTCWLYFHHWPGCGEKADGVGGGWWGGVG